MLRRTNLYPCVGVAHHSDEDVEEDDDGDDVIGGVEEQAHGLGE